jgi:glycosyltransferase involved in cell wall biosynthesis
LLVPHVFRLADRVLVQAEPLAAEILEQFDRPRLRRIRNRLRDRIGVVPNGVDLQPRRYGSGTGIVYVGRLIRAKGLDELVDAMQRLPGEHLTIVGDGPERKRLEEKARGLSVTFTGHVDHATARQHIRAARCLALPSYTEAFPNVVLEAMASGVPVVATLTGGVPSLVQDGKTGFLVPPGSVEDLAGALAKLTQDESLCLTMGASAHDVAGSFSWPRAVERLVDQIELVLAGRRGSTALDAHQSDSDQSADK